MDANATKDEKDQFEKLLSICNNQFMLQIIEEPTREENTLDLIFTNEMSPWPTIDTAAYVTFKRLEIRGHCVL